jgi:hypothetical protein
MDAQAKTMQSKEFARELYALKDANKHIRKDVLFIPGVEVGSVDLDGWTAHSHSDHYLRLVGRDSPHVYLFTLEGGVKKVSLDTIEYTYRRDTVAAYKIEKAKDPNKLPNLHSLGITPRQITRMGMIKGANGRTLMHLIQELVEVNPDRLEIELDKVRIYTEKTLQRVREAILE